MTSALLQQQITPGAWLSKVIANPQLAINLLQQDANSAISKATSLFQNSFIQGYHAGMWLLVGSSIIALFSILFLMKPTRKEVAKRRSDTK